MKRVIRTVGVVLGVLVCLLLLTTGSHYVLTKRDQNNLPTYGQEVMVNQKAMNVLMQGEGEKTIVLLPGFGTGSPGLDFTPLTNDLSEHFRVIVIEPFGYGLSDAAPSDRTIEAMTQEIHACLQELGVSEYILMPHSIAGIYSLYYCNQYPEEVLGVVGIDTSVPYQFDYMSSDGGTKILSLLSDLGILRLGTAVFPQLIMPKEADAAYTKEIRGNIRKLTLLNFKNTASEQEQIIRNFDMVKPMRFSKDVPLLFFLSTDTIKQSGDWWLQEHEKQMEGVKKAEVVQLDGPHYLHHTYANEMAQKVVQFFGEA